MISEEATARGTPVTAIARCSFACSEHAWDRSASLAIPSEPPQLGQGERINLIEVTKKVVTSALLLVVLDGAGAVMNGCAYGGVATTPDGTVVIARNDFLLFGLLRKVYTCKNNGGQLTCVETAAP
ncbi:MAG: hypothetical protein ABI560_12000 [Myxococcales bacterium]